MITVLEHLYEGAFQKFEEYREVGSFKKDTALTGHTVADIVIIMQSLPTC